MQLGIIVLAKTDNSQPVASGDKFSMPTSRTSFAAAASHSSRKQIAETYAKTNRGGVILGCTVRMLN